ncbi:MAG: citrate transporter, partial [Oscillospiraceae bacterium]
NEVLTAVAASQVISNVPAALLLSGFTDNCSALIVGTNLGGLGTLIASMASLISYKQLAAKYPEKKGKYLLVFTAANAAFLAVLVCEYFLLRAV